MSRVESEGAYPTGPESKRSASGKGCQPSSPSSPNRLPFPSLPFRPLPAPSCRASPRRLLTRHCMSRLERPSRLAASRGGCCRTQCRRALRHPTTRAAQPDQRPSSGVFPILHLSFLPVLSTHNSRHSPHLLTPYSTRIRRNWMSTGFNATRVEAGPTNRATNDQSPNNPEDSRRQAVVGAQSIARTHSLFSTR